MNARINLPRFGRRSGVLLIAFIIITGLFAWRGFNTGIPMADAALWRSKTDRKFDSRSPQDWSDLATYYGHGEDVKKAFVYYAKAVALAPADPTIYQNFSTTVFLYRKDAREYYGIGEQMVFDKALDLSRQALALDPLNFALAHEHAQMFYGIRPKRVEDALAAWNEAMDVATDEIDRQGVHLHLARFEILAGRFDTARSHLGAVTNRAFTRTKRTIARNLEDAERKAQPASATAKPSTGV